MTTKKTTFKQRIRRNDLKQRNEVSRDLKKRMRIQNRNHNRFDGVHQSGRSMEELVHEVQETGGAIAARDSDLDPRSLADLLKAVDPTTGKKKLVAAVDKSHPAALPELTEEELTAVRMLNRKETDNQGTNRNRYKHRGAAHLFWERVGLHPLLLEALKTIKFTHPTPVQEEVLPTVLNYSEDKSASSKKKKDSSDKKRDRAEPMQTLTKDVVVSAETGSGKTLVFALPILNQILLQLEAENPEAFASCSAAVSSAPSADDESLESRPVEKLKKENPTKDKQKKRRTEDSHNEEKVSAPLGDSKQSGASTRIMHTLIVSPTRELALQIKAAMEQLTQHARQVRIGCVVGGMAPEKQQRVLNRAPHVLICTPGRLWDLLQYNEGCYLGHSISRRLKFVILDEADKLLQSGRFQELKNILERIHCDVLPAGPGQRVRDENENETLRFDDETGDADTEESLEAGRWDEKKKKFVPFTTAEMEAMKAKSKSKTNVCSGAVVAKDRPRPMVMPPPPAEGHRVVTFVTSATLSLQTNYQRKDFKGSKSIIRTTNASTMRAVLHELCIREKDAHVFNMSPDAGVVAKINETFLRCPEESKDLYLYYFLRTYKERTIIFVNAISMLRRLTHILEVLGIPVVGLHASMQQRQRLKFIERFRTGEKRVLVATDIASRGIDIEGLRYVLHYQVPRSTDAYIHRCGRTARCGGTGLSVLMVNPSEYVSFKKLLQSLGRSEKSMETFSLEPTVVHHLNPHLQVALQIDKLQREIGKTSAGARWVKRMSDEAEVDADDMVDEQKLGENTEKQKVIRVLKKRLEQMTKKDMGHFGGKGAFRSGAKALGSIEAMGKLRQRADRQTIAGAKY